MVTDKLLEVLSRFLELEHQHDGLLGPVRGLQQVVGLEGPVQGPVREALEEGAGAEVPDRSPAHDVEAQRTEDGEVDGGVGLLQEARLLRLARDAGANGQGSEHDLHQELPREGQREDVEADEGEVQRPLAVLAGRERIVVERVGQEDGRVHETGRGRIVRVQSQDEQDADERSDPGVSDREAAPSAEEAPRLASTLRHRPPTYFSQLCRRLWVPVSREHQAPPSEMAPTPSRTSATGPSIADVAGVAESPRISTPSAPDAARYRCIVRTANETSPDDEAGCKARSGGGGGGWPRSARWHAQAQVMAVTRPVNLTLRRREQACARAFVWASSPNGDFWPCGTCLFSARLAYRAEKGYSASILVPRTILTIPTVLRD